MKPLDPRPYALACSRLTICHAAACSIADNYLLDEAFAKMPNLLEVE